MGQRKLAKYNYKNCRKAGLSRQWALEVPPAGGGRHRRLVAERQDKAGGRWTLQGQEVGRLSAQ